MIRYEGQGLCLAPFSCYETRNKMKMKYNWNFAAKDILAELMIKDENLRLDPVILSRYKSIGGMGESRQYLFAVSFEDNSKVGLDLFFMLSDYSHYFNADEFGDSPADKRSWGIRHAILNEQREGEYYDVFDGERLDMRDSALYWDGLKIAGLTQIHN